MNFSLEDLDAAAENYNYTKDLPEYTEETIFPPLGWIILISITLITCCIGFVGNGYIIWILGFQIKRNPFTVLVLNLAIADLGFLIAIFIYSIELIFNITDNNSFFIFHFICAFFYQIMYVNSHFLLAAISIDRCVSVLFPIWHRCSRPTYLSPVVCAILWISSFLMGGILKIMYHFGHYGLAGLHYLVTAAVCFPLITVSTVILFIKVGLKCKQRNQGRLLLIILITLLCFLILAFPLNIMVLILNVVDVKYDSKLPYWIACIILCSCLNSSINPVIYFLVGRRKQAQSKEGLKVILQKVFKDDEDTGGRKNSSNPPTSPLPLFLRSRE